MKGRRWGTDWVKGLYPFTLRVTTTRSDSSDLHSRVHESVIWWSGFYAALEFGASCHGSFYFLRRKMPLQSPPILSRLKMALDNSTINFASIAEAIASKSFDKLSDICDNLMLQVAAEGVSFQADWPYSIHLLAHIYANDINSARFLWKSIPAAVKESQPEAVAAWRIGQNLWTRNHAGVYEAIRGFNWSPEAEAIVFSFVDLYRKNMFQLLLSAYSTIDVKEAAVFMGMSEEEATKYVLQEGWTLEPDSGMLTVKKQVVVTEQKLDQSKLQRLTEYVFHLEH